MMKLELSNLYMLLVSAGYDKKNFEELVVSIKKNDSKQLVREFASLKNSVEKLKHSIADQNNTNDSVSSDVKGKIYNILIVECGLSVNKCLALISSIIINTYPKRKIPVINAKKGFNASISSLERCFTKSELLHIASKLRNELAHGSSIDGDWMLKE